MFFIYIAGIPAKAFFLGFEERIVLLAGDFRSVNFGLSRCEEHGLGVVVASLQLRGSAPAVSSSAGVPLWAFL